MDVVKRETDERRKVGAMEVELEQASYPLSVDWSDDALHIQVVVEEGGLARLAQLAPRAVAGADRGTEEDYPGRAIGLPLVDVVVSGAGRARTGRRYAESTVGRRLRYVGHRGRLEGPWRELKVALEDPVIGVHAEVIYRVLDARGVLRCRTRLTNGSTVPVTVESVTSFLGSGLARSMRGGLGDLDLLWAENDWLAEGRWQRRAFRDALPDVNRAAHGGDSRARFGVTSAGTWSSGTYLPMGAAVNRRTDHAWVWQIEHNGGWHWELGEYGYRDPIELNSGAGPTDGYLALLGPTDAEHHWWLRLEPGESFETVPVAVALSSQGLEEAVGRITEYRRSVRRQHDDHRRLPVIFNDYMNTLMGDPTTERLAPLIAAASHAGAEYFCVDAGWYAGTGEKWWDTVGAWKPSATRFPRGIMEVFDQIKEEGMVPGLWLEPEVVGVRSPIVADLPDDAFFVRNGVRVVDQGRYHLNLAHPLVATHLDKVVDFLVDDLGVGYLKMDYNINVGPGTDAGTGSPGAGLLAHNQALLHWVDTVLDRHPSLTIENCASGGMRTDYALLACLQVQSTSDQQDMLRYPPIAAAAPMAIAPEQAGVWAYPQPGWDDDEIAFTLCGALLGRVVLSGHIDQMSAAQFQIVADAISTYKEIRADLSTALPFWPLGLPRWAESWVALGMRAQSVAYLVVWRRGGMDGALGADGPLDGTKVVLPMALADDEWRVAEVLYPLQAGARVKWDQRRDELVVTLPRTPSACLVRVGPGRTEGAVTRARASREHEEEPVKH